MRISWTREALGQLVEIEEFIARDSPERAAIFVDGLIDQTETVLVGNPNIGRMVPEVAKPEIRELIYRKYRVVYRVTENGIEILTVFEGHRLLRADEPGV
jgi:plasmid stabilization system protein ParE